jgi:hypothetical protein
MRMLTILIFGIDSAMRSGIAKTQDNNPNFPLSSIDTLQGLLLLADNGLPFLRLSQ